MIDIVKQYTDNPILDELVYELSIMATDCVLKDQNEADKYETVESIRNADLYDICINGRQKFSTFEYTVNDILNCFYILEEEADYYANHNDEIPENAKALLLKNKTKKFLDEWEDMNDYYRTLSGLPPYGTIGLTLEETGVDYSVIEMDIPKTTLVHKLTDGQIEMFDSYGLLDKMYEANKSHKYLKFVGKRKVNSHLARKAFNFSILYIAMPDSSEVYNSYIDALERNRVYFLNCLYSEAQKIDSPYYDKVMQFLVIINSVMDVLSTTQQFLIDREIFDLRTIKYIMEANGVDYFPDIPLKYQKRLVKNLNKLIKYKGSDKDIVDISSLFGFDDIEIFKYYLFKQRKVDENGEYTHILNEEGEELDEDNYELKFIRVPIDEYLDDNIRNINSHFDYEDIVSNDKTWNGPYDPKYVKQMILQKEFTSIRTKYMSIDTITEMTKLSFELPYFLSIINNSNVKKDKLGILIPTIDVGIEFNIVDIFAYLYALMYIYNNIEDSILDTTTKVMYIMGFNFETDLSELASYVENEGFTLEELGVADYMQAKEGIFTFSQLLNIYTNNKNIHDHLIKQMNKANNYRIYKIYKYIYDALMVTELNNDVYKIADGTIAKTYTEYLNYSSPVLYDSIMSIKEINDTSLKQQKISELINTVCDTVYEYLKDTELRYIFSNLPTISVDYVKQYMTKVVNFFKSYRITMLDAGTIYKFEEPVRLTVIDQLFVSILYYKKDFFIIKDKVDMSVWYHKGDYIQITDEVLVQKIYEYLREFKSKISIDDRIALINILLNKSDKFRYSENIDVKSIYQKITEYAIKEKAYLKSIYKKEDNISLIDKGNVFKWFNKLYQTNYRIQFEDNCTVKLI